ncbi:unnamed protein product [Chondrus crispus]|uniref:Uncharacterized protein n=1 Tax=Chondrus crispus TaxID=2769 RepID=R7QND6_CHOCR|nr:unnamed protein product [Chondrus crispus]CDF39614.1 unnamed protein product [Chondrus crispus]|eukprot:XP_005709908.1 unnamed protein product [Chondrus crispus]
MHEGSMKRHSTIRYYCTLETNVRHVSCIGRSEEKAGGARLGTKSDARRETGEKYPWVTIKPVRTRSPFPEDEVRASPSRSLNVVISGTRVPILIGFYVWAPCTRRREQLAASLEYCIPILCVETYPFCRCCTAAATLYKTPKIL